MRVRGVAEVSLWFVDMDVCLTWSRQRVDRIKAAVAKLMGSDKAALTFQVQPLSPKTITPFLIDYNSPQK